MLILYLFKKELLGKPKTTGEIKTRTQDSLRERHNPVSFRVPHYEAKQPCSETQRSNVKAPGGIRGRGERKATLHMDSQDHSVCPPALHRF